MNPVTEFLIRRWALPVEREPRIDELLKICELGGTALKLSELDARANWGKAAMLSTSASFDEPTPLVIVREKRGYYLQTWAHFQAEHLIANSLKARAEISARLRHRLSDTEEARVRMLFSSDAGGRGETSGKSVSRA